MELPSLIGEGARPGTAREGCPLAREGRWGDAMRCRSLRCGSSRAPGSVRRRAPARVRSGDCDPARRHPADRGEPAP